jgi:peptidyl-prolyl cis-trans isomerase B (cyclophilin B)
MSSSTPQSSQTNGMAIAALITSFFVSILGIILGFVALNQIKTSGEQGRGLALAGIIIGFVAVGITVLIIIISVATAATIGVAVNEIQMGEMG